MLSILGFGFLMGMRHAIEADHVAAMASLTTRAGSVRRAVPLGLSWGAGHTLMLAAFGLAAMVLGSALPAELAVYLERAVGVMLIALGGDVLVRLVRERVHFHPHRHDGVVHWHAHSHAGEKVHDPERHHHEHASGGSLRAFLVGIMHGMAGSAALVVLALQSMPSVATGVLYIVVFGIGSMLGMAALTAVVAWPMSLAERTLGWLHGGARAGVGALTIGLGGAILFAGALPF